MSNRHKISIVCVLTALLIIIVLLVVYDYKIQVVDVRNALSGVQVVDITDNMPTTKYNYDYTEYVTHTIEEFTTEDYSTFQDEYSTYIEETNMSSSVSMYNAELYNLCDKYFVVYSGSIRMSPIAPMAIANVETPGRADHNITWSALFPSAIVPVELMGTMDITTVVSNKEYQTALSKEISTRDRGALQMSPTYGTGNAKFNLLMSGTEKSKLQLVDTSQCSSWASGASDKAGDRFYIPDVLLRLSSAFTSAEEDMVRNNYLPNTDIQLFVMCSMYHHRSGVWTGKAHGGNTWNSSELAYEYSDNVSSAEFINVLKSYASTHSDCYSIDGKTAMSLYNDTFGDSSKYCSSTLVTSYPIKCLYAYIKLVQLYGG